MSIKALYMTAWNSTVPPVKRLYSALTRRQRVTVLVYHRVDNNYRDALSVGVEQFEEQCKVIADSNLAIDVDQLLTLKYRSSKPLVLISFDDGYACNYLNAAPILKKYNLPAIFFVTTGFIGTSKVFEHDADLYQDPVPLMTWDQVRELNNQGFTIGSHTVNHSRCSELEDVQLTNELAESKKTLETKLGCEVKHFAYPYGGRKDLRANQLDLVRAAGYKTCFSAYGASNTVPVDSYGICRFGVDYKFRENAFRARLEGYSLREEPR